MPKINFRFFQSPEFIFKMLPLIMLYFFVFYLGTQIIANQNKSNTELNVLSKTNQNLNLKLIEMKKNLEMKDEKLKEMSDQFESFKNQLSTLYESNKLDKDFEKISSQMALVCFNDTNKSKLFYGFQMYVYKENDVVNFCFFFFLLNQWFFLIFD